MSRKTSILLNRATLVAISVSFTDSALVSSGGGGLPWESPLQQIQQSITGPVAGFSALAAVTIACAMLIFGGELNDFARRLCYVALVGGGVLLRANRSSLCSVRTELPSARLMHRPSKELPIRRRRGHSGEGAMASF